MMNPDANSPITATHFEMNKPITASDFQMTKCNKCGKELVGVIYDYAKFWLCRECSDDKENSLYSSKGEKLKVISITNGYKYDSEQAQKYLKLNQIYTLESIHIHGSSTDITLQEIPDIKFNSVHFIQENFSSINQINSC